MKDFINPKRFGSESVQFAVFNSVCYELQNNGM